jgi:DNA repair exonuclease SbcCD ATPase subunit
MIRTSELREKKTYTLRNEDTSARTIIVEHPARIGWNLSPDSPKPEETSMGAYRFRVKVPPKQASTLEINESSPLETRFELNNITDDQIALMVREGSVNPAIEQALRRIIDQKAQVAALESEAEKHDAEITRIYDDQQRLRENLKVLKGSVEEKALTQRYTQQLSDQETHLEKLRLEKEDIEKKSAVAQEQVDKMIEDLSIEATL